MGIHKIKQEKHAFDQESDHNKKKENTLSTKKATKKKRKKLSFFSWSFSWSRAWCCLSCFLTFLAVFHKCSPQDYSRLDPKSCEDDAFCLFQSKEKELFSFSILSDLTKSFVIRIKSPAEILSSAPQIYNVPLEV